jgi:AcrR family transcriptional regulator
MPTYHRLPRKVREQQMLDAAVAVFSRLGYHDASVDEIAEAAGVSKPLVYTYLGTKEELFVACVEREGRRLMAALLAAAGQGATAKERLHCGLSAFLEFVVSSSDGWTVLYRQARGQEPFAEVIVALRAQMAEQVTGALIASPPGTPVSDPQRRAAQELFGHVVVGAAETMADWLLAHPGADPAQTARLLTDVLWTGAAALTDEHAADRAG